MVQAEGEKSESAPTSRGERLFMALPIFIKRPLMRMMFKDPHRAKELAGTVMLTAVGMFGEGGGGDPAHACIPWVSRSAVLPKSRS